MTFTVIIAIICLSIYGSEANEVPFNYDDHHPNENITFSDNFFKCKACDSLLMDDAIGVFNTSYTTLKGTVSSDTQSKSFNVTCITMSKDIPARFFNDTPNRLVIDFSYNGLRKIGLLVLPGHKNVIGVDLSFNEIQSIDVDSFELLINLEFVDLRNNRIEVLDFKLSNQKPLVVLHLENNRIQDLVTDNFCMENKVKQIHYSWNEMKWFVLPEHNQFRIIVDRCFDGIKSMSEHKYELHCNESSFQRLLGFKANPNTSDNLSTILQCLTGSIIELVMSRNFIGRLEASAFQRLTNLEILRLSDVQLLDFDFDVIKYCDKLSLLDISCINLKSIHNPLVLNGLRNLRGFHAAGNQLNNTSEILEHLSRTIDIIDLSDSAVTLNSTTFNRFRLLRVLALRNTGIFITEFDPFAELQNLQTLDISYNNLKTFNFTMLSTTLNRLYHFSCSYCQLDNVPDVIHHLGARLYGLDLSGNFIGEINVDTFKAFTILKHLNLSNTNLSTFDSGTLQNMKRLSIFTISHNKLQKVDLGLFPKSIEVLNFEGNDLIQIDNFNRSHFSLLGSLSISENQFSCEYLKQLVQEWNRTLKGDPWKQKHGINCRPEYSSAAENHDTSKTEKTLAVWPYVVIAFGSSAIVITLGIAGFQLVRRRPKRFLQQNIRFQTNIAYNREPFGTSPDSCEHIYEEIGPSTISYDKLRFDHVPMPSSVAKDWYDKPNLAKSADRCSCRY